jgi:hypothetical protein
VSADRRREILDELGRGDEIAVAERLKDEAVAFAGLLDDMPGDDGQLTSERVQELLAATSSAGESFLTVAFPVVEYADRAALETLPRALRQVTMTTAAARTDQTARRVAAVPAVGRLVWALAGFALHCDRPAALAILARARIRVPFYDDVEPVIALTALRHPDAFGQNAGVAFRDYYEWLAQLDLLEQYPLFRTELDAALLEVDLVLAMCTSRFRGRIYSSGRARDTVRRFTARIEDAAQRQALEDLFPGDGELEDRLEHAYAATEGDRNRFERGPASLFSED